MKPLFASSYLSLLRHPHDSGLPHGQHGRLATPVTRVADGTARRGRRSPLVRGGLCLAGLCTVWRVPPETSPMARPSYDRLFPSTLFQRSRPSSGVTMPTKTTHPSEDLSNPYGYSEMDWAAQLDPAYAARAEVRRLMQARRYALSQSEGTDRAGDLGVAGPPVWGGSPHAARPRLRRHQSGYSRPSKPRLSLEAVSPTVWESGRSRRWSRPGSSRRPPAPAGRGQEHHHCHCQPRRHPPRVDGYRHRAGQPTLTDHPPAGHRCDTPRIASLCRWNRAKALTPRSVLLHAVPRQRLVEGPARDNALPQRRWV